MTHTEEIIQIDDFTVESILEFINSESCTDKKESILEKTMYNHSVFYFSSHIDQLFQETFHVVSILNDNFCKNFDWKSVKQLYVLNKKIKTQSVIENKIVILNCFQSQDESIVHLFQKYFKDQKSFYIQYSNERHIDKLKTILRERSAFSKEDRNFGDSLLLIEYLLFFLNDCSMFTKQRNTGSDSNWLHWLKKQQKELLENKGQGNEKDIVQFVSKCWNEECVPKCVKWMIISWCMKIYFPFVHFVFKKLLNEFTLEETREKELYDPSDNFNRTVHSKMFTSINHYHLLNQWKKQIKSNAF